MRVISCLATLGAAIGSVNAFAPTGSSTSKTTTLQATQNDNNDLISVLKETHKYATKAVASALVAGALWAAPAATNVLLPPNHFVTSIASAKEMASASGSRVNKDAESLLRYGLPINNKEVRFVFVEVC